MKVILFYLAKLCAMCSPHPTPSLPCSPWWMTAQPGPVWKPGSRLCQAPLLCDSRMTSWSLGSSESKSMRLLHVCLPGSGPTHPRSAPFVFPGQSTGAPVSSNFSASCRRSRSLIHSTEPGALNVKILQVVLRSGRGCQPSPGRCGHPQDRTSVLRPHTWRGIQGPWGIGCGVAEALPEMRMRCHCDPVTAA